MNHQWIVLGEDNGRIKLVSKSSTSGLLPKGSYLTIEKGKSKFILRVDSSLQNEPYSPSPMIIDMDLSGLTQDQKCQNIVLAHRVKDISERDDGLVDFIRPQSIARRSNQNEIDLAMGSNDKSGPKVFIATVHAGQNQLLIDNDKAFITSRLPEEMFYHQMLICGKTGSGKTVCTKYLAQHFVEKMDGAVLAVNVKDVDFLMLDKASKTKAETIKEEWNILKEQPHGVDNFTVYYPANTTISSVKGVNQDICQKITLDVHSIEPEALTGLLNNISDIGAMNFPSIFRYWQIKKMGKCGKFSHFVDYFQKGENDDRVFATLNSRGDESIVTLHKGTFDNILRNLDPAIEFFDNDNAIALNEEHLLQRGKLSVINVAGQKGIQFGSIALRHLLHRIVEAKTQQKSEVPILIIIDEVHQFYNTDSSRDALGDLDTICRTGRSQKIGVVFSSQNPSDIPRGLSNVINTKIFFKTESSVARQFNLASDEIESLQKGFAACNIHDLSQLKIIKFPLSFAGVFE